MAWLAIPLAELTVVSTLLGGTAAFRLRHELTTLIAFTGGIVVAVALFDVLPEAIDAVHSPRRVTALIGAGFIGFFLVERVLVRTTGTSRSKRAHTRARRRARRGRPLAA